MRFAESQQQEDQSRGQLTDRFAEYGWPSETIHRDLGEDFFVRIYDKGISSGLAFLVQLKSTRAIDARLDQGNYINYQIKVKDLQHWNASAIPVVIVVWDIVKRTGNWIGVAGAIVQLDERTPSWRTQESVRVKIPASNGTDDTGLMRLRRLVADYFYPSFAAGKTLTAQLALEFPGSPEGVATLEAWQRHLSTGDQVEIDGKFIKDLRFSDWWTRLYGEIDVSKGRVVVGPTSSDKSFPARIEMVSVNGSTAVVPYVDLKVVKAGSDEFTLANDHQLIPLHFQIALRNSDKALEIKTTVVNPGANVCESRDSLSFFDAMVRGGRFRLSFLSTGSTFAGGFPEGLAKPPEPKLLETLKKLCLIQARTGCLLKLDSDWFLSPDDIDTIEQLVAILQTGRFVHQNMRATARFNKVALELMLEKQRRGEAIELTFVSDESYLMLLKVKIPLGRISQHVKGTLDVSTPEFEEAVVKLKSNELLEAKLVHAQVIEEFPNWLPKDNY